MSVREGVLLKTGRLFAAFLLVAACSLFFNSGVVLAASVVTSSSSLSLTEGGSAQEITVQLDAAPISGTPVNISIAAADASRLAISPASLAFDDTNWSQPQTVSIGAVDDSVHNTSDSASVLVKDTEGTYNPTTIAVTIADNDPTPETPPSPTSTTPTSPPTTTAATETAPAEEPIPEVLSLTDGQKIILDDLDGFLDGTVKRLELKQGETVYFTVDGEEHSITVKEMTADAILVTIASDPKDVTIGMLTTLDYDVDGNTTNDIRIKAVSVNGDLATLDFQRVVAASASQGSSSEGPRQIASHTGLILLIAGIVSFILLAGGLIWFFLRKRNMRRSKQTTAAEPTEDQPVQRPAPRLQKRPVPRPQAVQPQPQRKAPASIATKRRARPYQG